MTTADTPPVLHLIAGINGAGKTSFYDDSLASRTPGAEFVNADEIERDRWPDAIGQHAHQAAELAARRREELIAAGTSFVTETVFSHRSKLDRLDRAQAPVTRCQCAKNPYHASRNRARGPTSGRRPGPGAGCAQSPSPDRRSESVSSNPVAAVRYERYALIFDPGHSRLGTEALGLVERGIDPLFTSDPDEAHLLALQETGRVGALIVPGTIPLALLDVLIERISPQLWAGAASVVVVDPPADRALLRALRDRELSWVLREPYDAGEFRFVAAAALASDDKLDPRSGLRVPISMPVMVTTGGARRDGFVRNASIGGLYIAIDTPPDSGTRINVALAIGDCPIEVDADVAYSQASGAAGRAVQEGGMGVAFRGLDEPARATIAAFIGERIRSFRL